MLKTNLPTNCPGAITEWMNSTESDNDSQKVIASFVKGEGNKIDMITTDPLTNMVGVPGNYISKIVDRALLKEFSSPL